MNNLKFALSMTDGNAGENKGSVYSSGRTRSADNGRVLGIPGRFAGYSALTAATPLEPL